MRAIIHLFFQFALACSLLVCITCSHPQDEAVPLKSAMEIQDDMFIISQIHNAYDMIELAEIAEQKGTMKTSSRASALKDSQMTVLYLLTDFANQQKMRIPLARNNNLGEKRYLLSGNFDKEWNKIISQRTNQTVQHLEDYFLRADKESRRVIADVLNTIQSQQENLNNQNNVASNR